MVLLLLVLGAVILSLNYDALSQRFTGTVIGDLLFSREKEAVEELKFDVYSDSVFAWLEGGLAIASGPGMQLVDISGETVDTESVILQDPAVSGGSGKAVVWSPGNRDFYVLGIKEGIEKHKTDENVINISINKEDWIALSAEEEGYKGAVTVFNNKLKSVYKWYSGEGYLIDAALSDISDRMAALTVTSSGSKVTCFALSGQEERGSYISENALLFDLMYLSINRICALGENSAVFLSDRAELISSYNFSDGYLKDYSMDGSGFLTLVIGKYKTGSAASIITLSADGNVLGSIDIKKEVLSISACGKYLAVLYDDELLVYRSDLTEYARASDVTNVRQVLARPDGSVIMLTNSGAVVFST
ncbi:MAG TPA: hypothetical protein GXZ65_00475 [Clostridiales bacterium]|nr:hypothetical protein [Clostridiales bacterium]